MELLFLEQLKNLKINALDTTETANELVSIAVNEDHELEQQEHYEQMRKKLIQIKNEIESMENAIEHYFSYRDSR